MAMARGAALRRPRLARALSDDARAASRLGSASGGREAWERALAPGLARVDARVTDAVSALEGLRSDVPKWRCAFGAVRAIAGANNKHLLRPQLVLMGHTAARGHAEAAMQDPSPALVDFAAGVELQHLFMFVHDDMMDQALQRRGQDTIQVALRKQDRAEREVAGASARHLSAQTIQYLTTLVGDVLQAKSAQLLASGERGCGGAGALGGPSAMDVVLDGAFRAGAAQFDDILGWAAVESSLAAEGPSSEAGSRLLVRLLHDKASFHSFAAPLVAGIRLGAAEPMPELEAACEEVAMHVGAAFQGIDDVVDFVVEAKDSGKDRLQDLQAGRLSLPLFLLRQEATPAEWAEVVGILGSQSVLAPSERHHLLKMVHKYELTSAALSFVDDEVSRARAGLDDPALAGNGAAVLRRGLGVFVDGLADIAANLRRQAAPP